MPQTRSDSHVTVTRDNHRDVTRDQRSPVPSRPVPTPISTAAAAQSMVKFVFNQTSVTCASRLIGRTR